jgi:hypothetical protein
MQPSEASQPASVEEPWSKFDWIPFLGKEDVANLVATLEKACTENVAADAVVGSFTESYGEEIVASIPGFIDVGRLVESIRSDAATKNAVLATGRGKRYLEDVWDKIASLAESVAANQSDSQDSQSLTSSEAEHKEPQEPDASEDSQGAQH